MIRAALLACCLIAGPLSAQQKTADSCRIGWQAWSTLIDFDGPIAQIQPDVTDKGWCLVDESNADLRRDDFTSLTFRGTGIEAAVENQGAPQSLEVKIAGIDLYNGFGLRGDPALSGPRAEMDIAYTHDPKSRATQITALELEVGELGHIKLSARGGGVDISSLKAMQITWGAGRLNDFSFQLKTKPMLSAALLAELRMDVLELVVGALPEESIDPESRDSLRRFLKAGPDAAGMLRLSGNSEAGFGFCRSPEA